MCSRQQTMGLKKFSVVSEIRASFIGREKNAIVPPSVGGKT